MFKIQGVIVRNWVARESRRPGLYSWESVHLLEVGHSCSSSCLSLFFYEQVMMLSDLMWDYMLCCLLLSNRAVNDQVLSVGNEAPRHDDIWEQNPALFTAPLDFWQGVSNLNTRTALLVSTVFTAVFCEGVGKLHSSTAWPVTIE